MLHRYPAPVHCELVFDEGLSDQQLILCTLQLPELPLDANDGCSLGCESIECLPASGSSPEEVSMKQSGCVQTGEPVVGSCDGTEIKQLLNLLAIKQAGTMEMP